MIWKLVKFYRTPHEKVIKEFTHYQEAVNLYNILNTESNCLMMEIFFEELVWSGLKNKWELSKFTVRSSKLG